MNTAAPGLDQSWVVEASAGTGKTTALVNRIVEVIAGGTPVESIVAVTFTHAAAGNMKLRVRHVLEQRRAAEADPQVQARLAGAAQSLDRAFIGTIHAFCAQLLRRRPVEAGVDPVFQELAQPDSLRVFGRVFQRWIEQRLASPSPALVRALARLSWREERDGSEPLEALRYAAWSLAEWRDFDAPWDKRDFDRNASLQTVLEQAEGVLALRNRRPPGRDILYDGLRPLAELMQRVTRALDAGLFDADLVESEVLRLPNEMRWLKRGNGKYSDTVSREAVVAAWEELKAAIEAFRREADADLAAHLRDELWEVVGLYQQQKKMAGQLDFMDLLLYARDLLHHDGARSDLQQTYQRIFVDEFQDTDPLQSEILLLLASGDAAERDWRKATPLPGKLYVVGDPKQSIYRFRRADARLFRRVCRDLTDAGVARNELTSSTRSTQSIQSFVNAAFQDTIPDYLPLEGGVDDPPDQPAVVALPMPHPYGTRNLSNAKIEECSPAAVAAFIQWLCNESGWTVRDRTSGARVPVRPEHVCILFRRFTNFGTDLTQEYVRALEARSIAHLLVGSKSFHRREEVGTLRAALRAVEWPDDELSVFAVLRGSLYSVPDDTLLRFRNEHKRFHPMRELPEELDDDFRPIREAFATLSELHRRRNYRPVADTIHELLEATRAHAGFAFRKGGERVLANVYRLTDLARSFEASGAATSFRAFVEYLDGEYESGDTGEAPILEQEGGGVQLMTVHKAKGLEFPVVILADLTAKLKGREGGDRYSDPERRLCAQRLVWCAPWELLDAAEEEAKADEEEALRVAYVAATRARDLLVVATIGEEDRPGGWLSPLHEALYPPQDRWRISDVAPGCPKFGWSTVLNRPADQPEEVSVKPGLHRPKAGSHTVVWFDPAVLALRVAKAEGVENEQVLTGTPEQAVEGLRLYQEWKDARARRLRDGSVERYRVEQAESFGKAAEAAHIPVETVTLPLAMGRPTGRKFGRVVHDILQHAGSAEDAAGLAEIWGRRHAVTQDDCRAAAEAARQALEYLAQAMPAGAERHRELPVMVRLADGRLLDGRIDLAWRDASGWTVVDYKTDRRDKRNLSQVQIYAWALEQATGAPARGIVLEV
ncbi:MAG TPA: UvrD-helicase domain-containing protein [Candidatus Sulfopaludibacter sp.]|jgi:ATP-dependent exoDNAse (exonuclease V) beta subunit|nr:UvrD-helicase domain-containing protein [Candidatus Sulfopaludibacter sp.]